MVSYELPQELIAQRPCEPRDSARLLALDRAGGQISHRVFRELPDLLRPGDCLVLNDTKVIPARLYGKRADTGGKVELLILRQACPERDVRPSTGSGRTASRRAQDERGWVYWCLGQPGRRLRPGMRLLFNHGSVQGEVLSSQEGEKQVRFSESVDEKLLNELGEVPLPPYIRRPAEAEDAGWYQTVFAKKPGAVAAPTAGLHFTPELLDRIRQQGVRIVFVTLHVGWGTFKPVGEKELAAGRMHPERFSIPEETLEAIRETKATGGRVVAVGTTVVRTLETISQMSSSRKRGSIPAGACPRLRPRAGMTEGVTDLFIRPPYPFRMVDAMVTNFHLPGTSLLYLVAAFAGQGRILAVYREAIRQGYRFYSYGDAMLIL